MSVFNSAEAVGDEFVTRLGRCTVAQGAETDLGAKVYRGLRRVEDKLVPCSVVIEGNDYPARGEVATEYLIAQRYVLLGFVRCDPLNPNAAAHKAIRDMKRAVFSTDGRLDPRWGGRLRHLKYLGRDIGPRDDGQGFVVVAIEVEAGYVENVATP